MISQKNMSSSGDNGFISQDKTRKLTLLEKVQNLSPPRCGLGVTLLVADARRRQCIGGSRCPGLGTQVCTDSILVGPGTCGSVGPLLGGWGDLGPLGLGLVPRLAADRACGHVTAVSCSFFTVAAV